MALAKKRRMVHPFPANQGTLISSEYRWASSSEYLISRGQLQDGLDMRLIVGLQGAGLPGPSTISQGRVQNVREAPGKMRASRRGAVVWIGSANPICRFAACSPERVRLASVEVTEVWRSHRLLSVYVTVIWAKYWVCGFGVPDAQPGPLWLHPKSSSKAKARK